MSVDPKTGDRLGAYVLDGLLGRGGMGSVYVGTHHLLGRKAAIKVLPTELAKSQDLVSRFFHEAKIVNDVRHPNIIDITDFIQEQDPPRVAYVMELIDGVPLSKALKTHQFDAAQAVNVTLRIAEALAAVHTIGVVHRDLKPANVMLNAELSCKFDYPGSVKVLDFGIAKVGTETAAAHKTGTGVILGTPAYMAPEQVAGEKITSAADVYALAEILYELLSGTRVFTGTNVTIMRDKITGVVPDLPSMEDPACAPVVELVRRCLVSEPDARPALSDVITDLSAFLGVRPSTPAHDASSLAEDATVEDTFVRNSDAGGANEVAAASLASAALSEPDAAHVTAPQTLGPPASEQRKPIPPWALGGVVMVLSAVLVVVGAHLSQQAPEVSVTPSTAVAPPPPVEAPDPAPSEPPPAEPAPAAEPTRVEAQRKRTKKRRPAKKRKRRAPSSPVDAPSARGTSPTFAKRARPKVAQGKLTIDAWTTAGRRLPAEVRVDGRVLPRRTPIDVEVPAGVRQIEVRAPGYPPQRRTVTVKADARKTVKVILDL